MITTMLLSQQCYYNVAVITLLVQHKESIITMGLPACHFSPDSGQGCHYTNNSKGKSNGYFSKKTLAMKSLE